MLTLLSCAEANQTVIGNFLQFLNEAKTKPMIGPRTIKLNTVVAMEKEQITFHCSGKENKGLISQLWYKESGLINKDQDQFLGEKLVLKNIQQEKEATKYHTKENYK